MKTALVCFVVCASAACLDPLTSDETAPSGAILPNGSAVPSASAETNAIIAANDGVTGTVPLLSGFADGRSVSYWDFGAAPSFGAPLFALVERLDDGELQPLSHPPIVDVIPGDAGYSPYWPIFFAVVTDAYNGEVIASVDALTEAEERGLVEAPFEADLAVNCPVVADDVVLSMGTGQPPVAPSLFYWRGQTIYYFDFGPIPFENGNVPVQDVYRLRRSGGEVLDESVRGVDITNDGDVSDTNNIFAAHVDDLDAPPLCRWTEVAVPNTTVAIDTNEDDKATSLSTRSDLFNPDPVPGVVLSITDMPGLWNCPQRSEGGL